MRPSRLGTIAILIGCALAVAFAPPAARAQQGKSTWGQILIADGPSVDLYDPVSNRFAPKLATSRMKGRGRV